MRKQRKLKRRSCAMCKPNKMGWANRWPARDLKVMKPTDNEMRAAKEGAGWG